MLLRIALAIPAIVSIGAWCVQLVTRFPPRSLGAGLTAITWAAGSWLELIPVTIAITRLIRNPETRQLRNYVLTAVATLALLPMLVVYLLVMLT